MKVGELLGLIAAVSQHDPDADVVVTWEGIFVGLDQRSIYKTPRGVVVIDADSCIYKSDIEAGKLAPGEESE